MGLGGESSDRRGRVSSRGGQSPADAGAVCGAEQQTSVSPVVRLLGFIRRLVAPLDAVVRGQEGSNALSTGGEVSSRTNLLRWLLAFLVVALGMYMRKVLRRRQLGPMAAAGRVLRAFANIVLGDLR